MLHVYTVNGFRKMLAISEIATISEMRDTGRSKAVITMKNGEVVFVANRYDDLERALYDGSSVETHEDNNGEGEEN